LIAAQGLEAIARRHPKVAERLGRIEHGQLAHRHPLDLRIQLLAPVP
jgi:hypothetical protein